MPGWTYLYFYPSFLLRWLVTNIPEGNFVWFACLWEIVVCWAGPFLALSFVFTQSEDMDNCMPFFHQPFLISIDSWLMSCSSLEMQTQVLPWLSLASNGMSESCSSLFVSNTPAILMVKEGTPLVLAWKLHLQWLEGCLLVPMVVHDSTRHRR
jgi:hypothetical protein